MYEDYGQIPSDVTLTKDAKIKADPIATAQFATIANTSVLQPTLDIMNNNFWTPATNFGANLANGTVTLDNAVAQTTAFNNSLNGKTN
jgi:arabinogalactan oligomer/maltooligosaccharide transport system substrate-binding protein